MITAVMENLMELSELKVSAIDKNVRFSDPNKAKEIMDTRRKHISITYMCWITKGIGCDGVDLYQQKTLIMIFLN